jgi:peptide deformylase
MMGSTKLKILQLGEKVLRQEARPLAPEEIRSPQIQELIEMMRETMRDAPGVGLAAPQIGLGLQLAVIEDRVEYQKDIAADVLADRGRKPVPFHVLVNPVIALGNQPAEFFEGCLSMAGFSALVPRTLTARVEALNEKAEPVVIEASGWYARILQHEIDHLHGVVYVDRMRSRSLMTVENFSRSWKDKSLAQIRAELGV